MPWPAIAILTQPLTLVQIVAIAVICGSVGIEFVTRTGQRTGSEPVAKKTG